MQRTEFLKTLQESLEGEMPASEIAGNIQYYKDYIASESTIKGENAIIKELGDPRLIAKTIIDTYRLSNEGNVGSGYRYDSGTYDENPYTRNKKADGDGVAVNLNGKQIRIPKWAGYVIAAFAISLVVAILVFIGRIAIAVLRVAFPFLIIVLILRWALKRR